MKHRVWLALLLFAPPLLIGQTQDWTGVPQPNQNPAWAQAYSQAYSEAEASYNKLSIPNQGIPQSAVSWAQNSEILLSAKWNYYEKVTGKSMTTNPQYYADVQKYDQGCYPQCPNFSTTSTASKGGVTTSHTAAQNTINPVLYGAAALSRGLVSPTQVASEDSDAEAKQLFGEVPPYEPRSQGAPSPSPTDDPDDPVELPDPTPQLIVYPSPELPAQKCLTWEGCVQDWNHPENFPDVPPPGAGQLIVFPGASPVQPTPQPPAPPPGQENPVNNGPVPGNGAANQQADASTPSTTPVPDSPKKEDTPDAENDCSLLTICNVKRTIIFTANQISEKAQPYIDQYNSTVDALRQFRDGYQSMKNGDFLTPPNPENPDAGGKHE